MGFARGELGWRPTANSALFAFGDATVGATPGWQAGLGARVTW